MSRIVTASSAEWPSSLDELGPYDPPARLFVAGRSRHH